MSTMSIKDLSAKQRSNVEACLRNGLMNVSAGEAVTAVRTNCHVRLSPQGLGKLRSMLREQDQASANIGNGNGHAELDAPSVSSGSAGGSPSVLTRANYMFEIPRLDKQDLSALAVHLWGENDRLKEDLRVANEALERKNGLLLKVMQQQ